MSVFDDLGDVVTSIFDRVPGSDWIQKAVSDGADWLGKGAKTPFGFWALQVITNNLYGPLAATTITLPAVGAASGVSLTVGPQLASAIFAVPGMIAGESFTEAYVKEMVNRVVELIEYFAQKGAGDAVRAGTKPAADAAIAQAKAASDSAVKAFTDQVARLSTDPNLRDVVAKLERDLGVKVGQLSREALRAGLDKIGFSPEQIAAKLHVRADAAGAALNGILHRPVYATTTEYDDATGAPKVPGAPDVIGAPIPSLELAFAQKRLSLLHLGGGLDALGVGGPATTNAIRTFQASHGLPPTGTADATTNQALQSAIDAAKTVVPFSEVQRIAATRGIAVNDNGAVRPSVRSILVGLFQVTLITSPVWFTWFVLPKLLKKTGGRPSAARGSRVGRQHGSRARHVLQPSARAAGVVRRRA